MRTLRLRSAVVAEVRAYLTNLGYVEVETPMMQPMAGGAAARPFTTHHKALDIPLYLRIAPELYLKRLLVGGFTKVFELNRNFRNEGISPRHNPEFTMLEAYEAFGSWETMADLVEGMVCHIAEKLFGGLRIEHKDQRGETFKAINLQRPWRKVRMDALVHEMTGWEFRKEKISFRELTEVFKAERVRVAHSLAGEYRVYGRSVKPLDDLVDGADFFAALTNVSSSLELKASEALRDGKTSGSQSSAELSAASMSFKGFGPQILDRQQKTSILLEQQEPAEQLQTIYEKFVEPWIVNPHFVTHVPSVIIPLAKKNAADPFFADVYELAINGQEISPGYSELNDPDVQAANFATQVGDDAEKQKTDDDFLTALKYGMPPAGGLGLGIDRLVMMLTGAQSIRDVILFPLMRPVDRG